MLRHGYNLYVDKWYASQSLFEYLYEHDTVSAGTARKNRIDLPKSFKDKKLEKNEHDFRRNENLLAVKLQDKKEILMLWTVHTANVIQTGKEDQNGIIATKKWVELTKTTRCLETIVAWDRHTSGKLRSFFHFLEEAIFNSFLLYNKNNGKKTFLEFKVEVVCQMLGSANITIAVPHLFDSLKGCHFPSEIPPTEKKVKLQKRCVVCYSKEIQKEIRHHCNNCEQKLGLCPASCFTLHHTLVDYS